MKKDPKKARNHIESKGIIIEPNKAYNIYQCGHVVLNSDDPKRNPKNPEKKYRRYRSCPECPAKFLAKFKVCECGTETVGSQIQDGRCKPCSYDRSLKLDRCRPEAKSKSKTPKPGIPKEKYIQAHRDRFDCYMRDKCLAETVTTNPLAEYLPCYGCEKYRAGCGNVDPMLGVYRHGDVRANPARQYV